jgi:hypothetical protein
LKFSKKEHCLILVPLCLDDAIMRIDQDWSTRILKTRPMGDFTAWEHDDQYQKALVRLLNDLKSTRFA